MIKICKSSGSEHQCYLKHKFTFALWFLYLVTEIFYEFIIINLPCFTFYRQANHYSFSIRAYLHYNISTARCSHYACINVCVCVCMCLLQGPCWVRLSRPCPATAPCQFSHLEFRLDIHHHSSFISTLQTLPKQVIVSEQNLFISSFTSIKGYKIGSLYYTISYWLS